MNEDAVIKAGQLPDDPAFKFFRIFFSLNQDVAKAAQDFARWERSVFYRIKQRIQFKSECFSTEWVKLGYKGIKVFLLKELKEQRSPFLFYFIKRYSLVARLQIFEIVIHLKARQFEDTEVVRDKSYCRSAEDHGYMMLLCQGTTEFLASMKMADTKYMLTINRNLHFNSRQY